MTKREMNARYKYYVQRSNKTSQSPRNKAGNILALIITLVFIVLIVIGYGGK